VPTSTFAKYGTDKGKGNNPNSKKNENPLFGTMTLQHKPHSRTCCVKPPFLRGKEFTYYIPDRLEATNQSDRRDFRIVCRSLDRIPELVYL
jgi:hypothetical protein